tara:strand:- start:11508 stop:11984 length:477 start_codon:yes stop_codon:yes gene_type:complete
MSDSEDVFMNDEEEYIPIKKQKKEKKKKPRKEMTPERKAKLLEQLAKGRETAMRNRTKTAQYNKIIKDKEKKRVDDVLEDDYKKRNNKINYEKENEELRNKLKMFEEKKEEPKIEMKIEEPVVKPVQSEAVEPVEKVIEAPEKPKIINSGRIKRNFWI